MKERNISRRQFLTWAGGALGASVLACGGLGIWASQSPEIAFVESSCAKEKKVSKKTLIAYDSRAGSTGEVAQAISEVLCEAGMPVDVRRIKEVTDLSPYGAVLVGSPIYMGRWMSGAVDFVKDHRETLSQVPTAYFTVCATLREDTPENRSEVAAYLDPLREQVPQVQPVDVGMFAGRVDPSKLSLFYRTVIKLMGDGAEGDFRDWEAIRTWAGSLVPQLTAA